jgi:nucleotide-binding universal stress UspA family protein
MTEAAPPLPELGPIVVGFDGSTQGEDALGLALWFGRILGLSLVVAAVHPSPAAISPARVDAEWVADRHRLAERVLDGARSQIDALTGPPTQVEYRIVASSSAAHGLLDLAEELTASLIVVGSGSQGTEERLFAGSTAERLLSGSPCPVAVAPSGARNRTPGALTRIGVAYVDVPEANAALEVAARLARRTSAELRLYTVVADEAEVLPLLIGRDAERAFLATAREQYQFALDTAIAGLPPGLQATGQILTGDVVDVLAELDEDDIDVLFCGSRGYGPVRSVLLGGVSSRLVRRARSPLVVVPRES